MVLVFVSRVADFALSRIGKLRPLAGKFGMSGESPRTVGLFGEWQGKQGDLVSQAAHCVGIVRRAMTHIPTTGGSHAMTVPKSGHEFHFPIQNVGELDTRLRNTVVSYSIFSSVGVWKRFEQRCLATRNSPGAEFCNSVLQNASVSRTRDKQSLGVSRDRPSARPTPQDRSGYSRKELI